MLYHVHIQHALCTSIDPCTNSRSLQPDNQVIYVTVEQSGDRTLPCLTPLDAWNLDENWQIPTNGNSGTPCCRSFINNSRWHALSYTLDKFRKQPKRLHVDSQESNSLFHCKREQMAAMTFLVSNFFTLSPPILTVFRHYYNFFDLRTQCRG